MSFSEFRNQIISSKLLKDFNQSLEQSDAKLHFKSSINTASALFSAQLENSENHKLFILRDKDEAAYFLNDLQCFVKDEEKVLFFPASYKTPYEEEKTTNANIHYRTEALTNLLKNKNCFIVSYPEAIAETVVTKKTLSSQVFKILQGETYTLDFIQEYLISQKFDEVDYVYQPGQYSVRGGIIDIYSFSKEHPYRIEFFGDEVDSIRFFNPVDQLSIEKVNIAEIAPNLQDTIEVEKRQNFIDFLGSDTHIWLRDYVLTIEKIDDFFKKAKEFYHVNNDSIKISSPSELYLSANNIRNLFSELKVVEFGTSFFYKPDEVFNYQIKPQPTFHKNFELLISDLKKYESLGYEIFVTASQQKQVERLITIFKDLNQEINFKPFVLNLHEGFVDETHKFICYTDHQIFERYHKFRLKQGFKKSQQSFTIKELQELQKGDFVAHIDHGIGKFAGLHKVENNGKLQEAIRIEYKDGDTIFVNIHSLHRISKYTGKEGKQPSLSKIGSPKWENLKKKTKAKVKALAFDLIQLYAKRKAQKGFAFGTDTYLQNELEASFFFEDTPDQYKATQDVKKDMESDMPMDRLVCGDVGFGKTEIAIRAAFKAVADSKQVAVLVPTTILSLQHFKNFAKRLADFPCNVDYLNRFKTAKQTKETLEKLKSGKIDILIGTHKLVSKNVKFKDLGLMIIDEEQKFGVNVKDKLKTFKATVDTLTLTATPIPRTLQFSLLGARDLSIINTPPVNRQPVETELIGFDEAKIRDAISFELDRGGQVFFVHNKVQNIHEVAGMIQRLVPDAKITVGHGQMEGEQLEKIMASFIDGTNDVLVATSIIESGIDISNANTMIINMAQNFGLADLHQLRGRVGRSNAKAFCYLIAPKISTLPTDSRKRLEAIVQFSDLGSGFNLAMKDLDIRGAGDLLGGEQSGFINDVGIELYQKILNEAVEELRENEFKELFKEELKNKKYFIEDSILETDLELLFPTSYIFNISERLALYQKLENCNTEEELNAYQNELIDRFGELPEEAKGLLESVKIRWAGKVIGFEKIVIKNNKMIGSFIQNQDSAYYQSAFFTRVLKYIQSNPPGVNMNEKNNKLRIVFSNINSVDEAQLALNKIVTTEL